MKKRIILAIFALTIVFGGVAFAAETLPISEDGTDAPVIEDVDVTCEDIGLISTLKRGKRGGEVMILQEILTNAGYYDGVIDGSFGAKTRSAVKMLQEAVGVKSDGVVGPTTRAAMREMCVDFVSGS